MAAKAKLTADLVHKIAGLANLPLTADEEKLYADQLAKILDYVEQLSSIDTSRVEPTFNATDLKNVTGEDKTSADQTLSQEDALQNAPESENSLFRTKVVLNHG